MVKTMPSQFLKQNSNLFFNYIDALESCRVPQAEHLQPCLDHLGLVASVKFVPLNGNYHEWSNLTSNPDLLTFAQKKVIELILIFKKY